MLSPRVGWEGAVKKLVILVVLAALAFAAYRAYVRGDFRSPQRARSPQPQRPAAARPSREPTLGDNTAKAFRSVQTGGGK